MEVSHHNQRRGAALMLSLWALFLLSAMVISWALSIDSRLTLSGYANRNLEALALACSGVEVAMHPNTTPGAEVLEGGFGRDQRYKARITGEGGRLNVNWLVVGENPARLEILRKYLEIKGIDLNERDRMIDTLLDWVDPDNIVHLNGAEDEPGYKPANRPLKRLEELKKVKGWEEFTSASDWDADLTLDSQGGAQPGGQAAAAGPNLAWASRDVILALPGMDEMRVDQFLAMRPGPDEIDGTEDDMFASIAEAEVALGSPPGQLAAIGVVYNKIDPVQRVVSVGKSGDVTRTVRVVFLKGGNQLKSWKEF
jgi:general secretion pathway protein K